MPLGSRNPEGGGLLLWLEGRNCWQVMVARRQQLKGPGRLSG